MENFTPIASTFGGVLIGLAAAILMYFNGRVAGISGILSGLFKPLEDTRGWQATFLGGMLAGGLAMSLVDPGAFAIDIGRSAAAVAAAGFLVGFGTRLGSGCTSGHGVCGLARFSKRSLVATATFMLFGGVTVYVVDHMLGGL
jgi:hypothetical protein